MLLYSFHLHIASLDGWYMMLGAAFSTWSKQRLTFFFFGETEEPLDGFDINIVLVRPDTYQLMIEASLIFMIISIDWQALFRSHRRIKTQIIPIFSE